MSDQYVGEIRWFPYGRGAPQNWLVCDGSLQPINEYEPLYVLIGTTYGGDGQTTFGLPDLRGRTPVHQGTGPGLPSYTLGQMAGTEQVTLTTPQLPVHNHVFQATTAAASSTSPSQLYPAALSGDAAMYAASAGGTALNPTGQMFGVTGQGQPHENCAPSLAILACICTAGQFPPRP
jgi:microcystin-dependent protein